MGCSSKVHRIRKRRGTASLPAIGSLPIPNSLTWPQEIRDWFRQILGDSGPFTVLIFARAGVGAMYLQDAVTAAALLDVEAEEWHTEGGYPAFEFPAEKIEPFADRLTRCGYAVRIVQLAEKTGHSEPKAGGRAEVISIKAARDRATIMTKAPEGAA